MKYQTRQALRLALLALIMVAGVVVITLVLHGCTTGWGPHSSDEPISAGHNTTLPALPTCLLFCNATVNSTVETTTTSVRRERTQAQAAASAARAASAPAAASRPASASKPASAPLPFPQRP